MNARRAFVAELNQIIATVNELPELLFEYDGVTYPEFLRHGNAMQHIAATALHFCKGKGVDVGGGKWPLPGAVVVDQGPGFEHASPTNLPDGHLEDGLWDYVFSSHFLEHAVNPVAALEHWKSKLRPGGVCFVYLPHPAQRYWLPQHCRKHLHSWMPEQMAQLFRDLGFVNVLHGERDLCWSFATVGWKP